MTKMILKSIKPTQDSSEHSEEYTKDYIKSDDWIEAGGIGNALSFLEILRPLEIFCTFKNYLC